MQTFFRPLLFAACLLLATSCFSVYTLRESAWNAEEQGNYTEAVALYTRALAMDSLCYECYIERSYAYRKLRQSAQAIYDLDTAIAINPAKAQGYYQRGYTYYDVGRYDKAIEDFTILTQLDRGNSRPYFYRGKSYAYCKRYEEALRDYNTILRDIPDDYNTLAARADVYFQQEEYLRALSDYNNAIESLHQYIYTARRIPQPDRLRPSKTKEIQRKTEERVEKLSQTLASYFQGKARTYQELQQYDLALESYSESLLWDSTAATYTNIGWLHYLANNFTDCITASQAALRVDSNALAARYNIALSYLRLGNFQQAQQEYRSTLAYVETHSYPKASVTKVQNLLWIPTVKEAQQAAINDLQSLLQRNIHTDEVRFILREIFQEHLDEK